MSDAGRGARGLVRLALAATALELATMVPCLAAVALIAGAGLTWPVTGAALAGYCLVMLVPAVPAAAVRIAARERVEPVLRRVDGWLTHNGAKAAGWTVGGIGIGVTLNAVINFAVGAA